MTDVARSGPGDLPAAAAAGRPVRYWDRPSVRWNAGVAAFLLAFATGCFVMCWYAFTTGGEPAPVHGVGIFAAVLGAAVIAFAFWTLPGSLRPALTIAAGSLRIPRGAYGTTRVPVTEVTGIGLVAERQLGTALPPHWHLTVWHGDQRREPVSIRYTPAKPAAIVTRTDPAELAESYAGQVAAEIYGYVLAEQGPGGLLAAIEQQKHVRIGSRWAEAQGVAFWSPDGVVGPVGH